MQYAELCDTITAQLINITTEVFEMNIGGLRLKKVSAAVLAALALVAVSVLPAFCAEKKYTQTELAYMPATEQIKLFKTGAITPTDVLEAQIARVKEFNGPVNTSREELKDYLNFNGKVNAICFDRFDEARKAAKEAELRYKNGTARPLEGITVGIKNENEVKGWRVDMGSLILKDAPVCENDGAIIDKLKAAGAIPVFSTNVPEFYVSSMTWNKLYGVTRNPWNLYYGVGGSSGGSCASLAAGFCTLATGSDMGGSIRIPAAMCGVYGFKPPFGRVPTSEICYETLGPLARTFGDMRLMQNIICGPSHKIHSSLRPKLEYPESYESLKGQKVALCYFKNWLSGGCDREVNVSMDKTAELLKKAGAEVVVIDLDWSAEKFIKTYINGLMSTEMYELIAMAEGHKELLCRYCEVFFKGDGDFGPKKLIEAGRMLNAMHKEIQKKVFAKGCMALVMPSLATPKVPADFEASPDKLADINGTQHKSIDICLTPLWNLLSRYPVVNVPVCLSARNVPVGIQIVGNTYDDLAAFRVASALSKTNRQLYTDGLFPDFRKEK